MQAFCQNKAQLESHKNYCSAKQRKRAHLSENCGQIFAVVLQSVVKPNLASVELANEQMTDPLPNPGHLEHLIDGVGLVKQADSILGELILLGFLLFLGTLLDVVGCKRIQDPNTSIFVLLGVIMLLRL